MKKIILLLLMLCLINVASADSVEIDSTETGTINSGSPTTVSSSFIAGYDTGTLRYKDGLVEFSDISNVPANATISSATVRFYAHYTIGGNTLTVLRTTSAVNYDTVTWNTKPTKTTANHTDFAVYTTGWVTVSITDLFKEWHSGSANNYGLYITGEYWLNDKETTFYEYDHDGAAPYITVVYTNNTAPGTPTLVTPANHSSSSTRPFTLNVTATDDEGDSLTYYYYGDKVDGSTFLGTSSTSHSWNVDKFDKYYWKARAYDGSAFGNYTIVFDFNYTAGTPTLLAPANSSHSYFEYPPLTDDITFNWLTNTSPQYNLLLATDVGFTNVETDTNLGTNTTSVALGNATYWWKVRVYDGTTYGSWSEVFNYNLILNETGYKATNAVQGVTYEVTDNGSSALSSVVVSLWNATYTASTTTGSNGYYLFDNLGPGAYNVQATKTGYDNSFVHYTNVTANNWTTQDIYLNSIGGYGLYYDEHHVTFKVMTGFFSPKEGVEVTVYKDGSYDVYASKTTPSNGEVDFILDKDQRYRMTFINETQGISYTYYVYPVKISYWIFVTTSSYSWTEYDISPVDGISVSVTREDFSALVGYVNVTYNATVTGTTSLTFYINQTDYTDPENQTVIQFWEGGAVDNAFYSFELTSHRGETYIVHVVAEHSTYDTVHRNFGVTFPLKSTFDGIPQWAWLYLGMFIMFITAGLALATAPEEGFFVVCAEGWIFWWFGWFTYYGSSRIELGLTAATIFAVFAYLSKKSKEGGYT